MLGQLELQDYRLAVGPNKKCLDAGTILDRNKSSSFFSIAGANQRIAESGFQTSINTAATWQITKNRLPFSAFE